MLRQVGFVREEWGLTLRYCWLFDVCLAFFSTYSTDSDSDSDSDTVCLSVCLSHNGRPLRSPPLEFGLAQALWPCPRLASRVAPSSGPGVRPPPLVGPPGARG